MSVDRSVLECKPREGSGKGSSRRLRAQGLVPAVVYGRHLDKPAHIAVHPKGIRIAVMTPHKLNTLLILKGAGADRQVLLKDFQVDPVSREILHADFIEVRENEQVKVNVPVVLVGRAVGVAEGGILNQVRRELEVYALPNAIPEKIEVDVTPLKVAESLHINDLKLPAGVKVKTHVNFTVAVVAIPEKEEVVVAPVAAAAVPGAPGAEAGKAAPGAGAEAGKAAPGAGAEAGKAAAPAKKDEKKK
jgi:large subunit ribosomal protein L25